MEKGFGGSLGKSARIDRRGGKKRGGENLGGTDDDFYHKVFFFRGRRMEARKKKKRGAHMKHSRLKGIEGRREAFFERKKRACLWGKRVPGGGQTKMGGVGRLQTGEKSRQEPISKKKKKNGEIFKREKKKRKRLDKGKEGGPLNP